MKPTEPKIKPGHLKQFFPFSEMPPEYVIISSNFAQPLAVRDGEIVLDASSEDPNDYFLLRGGIAVEDIYGAKSLMNSDAPDAAQPLPQLRPSAYRITANGEATLIKIPQEVVRRVRAEAPAKDPALEEDVTLDITQSREFFNDFKEELQMNRVRLPSLPRSANRVHGLLSANEIGAPNLVAAVSLDPAISAKLLKMANCSLFNADERVRNAQGVVSRLGVYSTREIAACFAFRDVYKNTSDELLMRLQRQVECAQLVSVMAAAIAEMNDVVDPATAALAGLLHNVGVLPIFSYAMHFVPFAANPELLDRAVVKIAHKAGVLLAKKWRFGDHIAEVIEHSGDWTYSNGDQPNLANIVLTARYHFYLSRSGLKGLPKPHEVPSIAAATSTSFDESVSLKILGRAKELLNNRAVA